MTGINGVESSMLAIQTREEEKRRELKHKVPKNCT